MAEARNQIILGILLWLHKQYLSFFVKNCLKDPLTNHEQHREMKLHLYLDGEMSWGSDLISRSLLAANRSELEAFSMRLNHYHNKSSMAFFIGFSLISSRNNAQEKIIEYYQHKIWKKNFQNSDIKSTKSSPDGWHPMWAIDDSSSGEVFKACKPAGSRQGSGSAAAQAACTAPNPSLPWLHIYTMQHIVRHHQHYSSCIS
jgi:hypothetical protein